MKIRELPVEWRKINMGCGHQGLPGWVNVDIYPFKGVNLIADLNNRWPWKDDSIHYIRAFDVVEHLRDPIHTMNEGWRVLKHGGIFEIWVPSTEGRGAFQDPTHVSYWNYNSFAYYSEAYLANYYPHLIQCNFELRVYDTNQKPDGVIWTWALCRAIKDPSKGPATANVWYDALTSLDAKGRIMQGFEGETLGTMPIGLDLLN